MVTPSPSLGISALEVRYEIISRKPTLEKLNICILAFGRGINPKDSAPKDSNPNPNYCFL